jgi:hypothetical protein
MRMKANGPFHTSETRTVKGGAEFEVHDELGKDLEARGVAIRIGDAQPEIKAEPELLNKIEPTPENKTRKRKVRIEEDADAPRQEED